MIVGTEMRRATSDCHSGEFELTVTHGHYGHQERISLSLPFSHINTRLMLSAPFLFLFLGCKIWPGKIDRHIGIKVTTTKPILNGPIRPQKL